ASVACAANVSAGGSGTSQSIVAGGFAEETIGLNNRLWVKGALRADGSSAFGTAFKGAIYPKASVSWLVTREPFLPRVPGSSLRLRAAYGASGVLPPPNETLSIVSLTQVPVAAGGTQPAASVPVFGNRDLKPERTQEFEFGADLSVFRERIQL